MVAVRSYLRAAALTQGRRRRVLTATNAFRHRTWPTATTARSAGEAGRAGGQLKLRQCGHHPPGFVVAPTAGSRPNCTAPAALGILADAEMPAEPPLALEAGDVVLLLTTCAWFRGARAGAHVTLVAPHRCTARQLGAVC